MQKRNKREKNTTLEKGKERKERIREGKEMEKNGITWAGC